MRGLIVLVGSVRNRGRDASRTAYSEGEILFPMVEAGMPLLQNRGRDASPTDNRGREAPPTA